MVGDKDKFECYKCGHSIITVEKEQGRAPFILPCLKGGCAGVMRSHFNRKVDVMGRTPDYELRFPDDEEYELMGMDFQQRVDNGKLLPFKKKQTGDPPTAVANQMRRIYE